MNHEPATTLSPFGARLRRWRASRGVSQLALAGMVGSTARHLSFLETGRSRPSRQMVLRLTDPDAARAIVNWADVAWAGLDRLRHAEGRRPSRVVELLAGTSKPR